MTSQDSLVREYVNIRDAIRLALEDIGQQLRREGHDYEIMDGVPNIPLISLPYAGVTLRVFPSDVNWKEIEKFGPLNKVPTITFGLNLAERKVDVISFPFCEGNRFGQRTARRVNQYNLNEVTPEVINEDVQKFLKEIPLEL